MEITLEPVHKRPQHVHLLPCQIDYTGPAQVSTYFVQSNAADPLTGVPCKVAAFRGRQLFGVMNRLPSEYKGHVYAERQHSEVMEDDTSVTHDCIEQFDEFTVWKHDNAPDTKNDPFFIAMEWNNIAAHVRQRMNGILIQEDMHANLTVMLTMLASLLHPNIKIDQELLDHAVLEQHFVYVAHGPNQKYFNENLCIYNLKIVGFSEKLVSSKKAIGSVERYNYVMYKKLMKE